MGKKRKVMERVKYSFRTQHCLSRFIYPDGSSFAAVTPWMNPTVPAEQTPEKRAVAQFYLTAREVNLQNWKGLGSASLQDASQISKYMERFGPKAADVGVGEQDEAAG